MGKLLKAQTIGNQWIFFFFLFSGHFGASKLAECLKTKKPLSMSGFNRLNFGGS